MEIFLFNYVTQPVFFTRQPFYLTRENAISETCVLLCHCYLQPPFMVHFDFNKWFLKYKVLHVIMWLIVGSSTLVTYYDSGLPALPQICNAGMVVIVSTIPFYTTAYAIIPTYLYKGRYLIFIILLLLLVAASGLLMMVCVRTIDHLFDSSRPIIAADSAKLRFDYNIFTWTSLIAAFGAGGLKIMSDSFKLRKKLLVVEKEKINTELNFLRSQVNPHFLFNVMNTIYFQIDKKNESARASVEKLSEMLRYQLYECNSDMIEINKELEYIKNYVAMQTLRLEKGADIQLHINVGNENFRIAPLLILPIVENAFKHISHFKDPAQNKIHISLNKQEGQFIVDASNSYDKTNDVSQVIQSGGLGVQNLRRRLELLYPGKHEIDINKNGNFFHTVMKLEYEA